MRSLGHERLAVAAVFLATGATFGTFAARVPAIQEGLELSAGQLGAAFAGLMAGAFAGLPLAGALAARLGSRRLLAASLLVFLAALAIVPLAPGLAALTALLFVFGASNSGVDVAVNVQGTHVERGYGRPILSGLHAMHSAGVLAAAGLSALAARAGVSAGVQFAAVAAALAMLALAALGRLTEEVREPGRARLLALPTRALAVPGAVAFCLVVAEDVANTWSAVYLRIGADSGGDVAAVGFAAYAAGMLAGRAGADRIVRARGARLTIAAGGLVAAAGMGLALAVPEPGAAIAGLFVLGVGLSPALPVVFSVVAETDPARAGTAIAAVTTIGYFGSIVGPPAVGGLAEPFGLRTALLVVPVSALAMALLASRLKAPRTVR